MVNDRWDWKIGRAGSIIFTVFAGFHEGFKTCRTPDGRFRALGGGEDIPGWLIFGRTPWSAPLQTAFNL
jgi:hypothetical protein